MERLLAIAGSVVLHLLIVGILFFTVWEETPTPKAVTHKPIIQARAVDEATAMAAVRAREAEEKRKADEKRKAIEREKKRKAAEAEKKRKKVEAEKKRQAALKRKKAEEEKKRKAEEQRKKAEAEKKRLAEEQRKKEEAERKRKEEEDRKRREDDLKQQMQEEAKRMEAEEQARYSEQFALERDAYIAAIQNAIQQKWRRPSGSSKNFTCKVLVKQIPSGDVISVRVIESSGNVMLDRSVESAVEKASPLPMPPNWHDSYRELEITFVPE